MPLRSPIADLDDLDDMEGLEGLDGLDGLDGLSVCIKRSPSFSRESFSVQSLPANGSPQMDPSKWRTQLLCASLRCRCLGMPAYISIHSFQLPSYTSTIVSAVRPFHRGEKQVEKFRV